MNPKRWPTEAQEALDAVRPYADGCLALEVPGATCQFPECDCFPVDARLKALEGK